MDGVYNSLISLVKFPSTWNLTERSGVAQRTNDGLFNGVLGEFDRKSSFLAHKALEVHMLEQRNEQRTTNVVCQCSADTIHAEVRIW